MEFKPFNYGNVVTTGENVLSNRQNRAKGANDLAKGANELKVSNLKMMHMGASQLAADPSSAPRVIPELMKLGAWDSRKDFTVMNPQAVQAEAKKLANSTGVALRSLGALDNKQANMVGKHNPGDYTTESWSVAYNPETGIVDPSKLERYTQERTLIKADMGDRYDFLHPYTGSVVRSEPKTLAPKDKPDNIKAGAFAKEEGSQQATEQFGPASVTANEQAKQTVLNKNVPLRSGLTTTQQELSKEEVKFKVARKKKEKAFSVYKVGRDNLYKALKNTTTGFLMGRLPAATASAQIAENAKMIMLPVLKSVVREAGEGVFTDADAKAVMALVPDRITSEDALEGVFANIDAYMNAKLAFSDTETATDINADKQDAVEGRQDEIDPALLEFMTPEERALFQ